MQAQELRKPVVISQASALYARAFGFLIIFMQIFFWPAVKLVSLFLGHSITIHLQKSDLKIEKRYVIAASHGSMLDAFIILHHFAFRGYPRIIPCRFFVHNGLFNRWLTPLLLAFGSFPTKPHLKWPSGLTAATKFLALGQSVLIFPEGKRNRGEQLKPRKGVAILAAEPNTEVIPVKISWGHGWLGGYKIIIGKPQQWAGRNADEILFDILTLE